MSKRSKASTVVRREYLLSFFDKEPVYQVILLKDHYLVKQQRGDGVWEVAIWPASSWKSANMDAHGHTVVRKHLVNT